MNIWLQGVNDSNNFCFFLKKERISMKTAKINREVSLTPKEAEEMIKGFLKAGVDKKVVGDIFDCGPTCSETAENCYHNCKRPSFDPGTKIRIQEIIREKKIDPKTLGKAATKFLD